MHNHVPRMLRVEGKNHQESKSIVFRVFEASLNLFLIVFEIVFLNHNFKSLGVILLLSYSIKMTPVASYKHES